MKFTPTEIPDVILIEPKVNEDPRGFFLEFYREDLYRAAGISAAFVQDNHSCSGRGVLRGLHYQVPPRAQAKLVRVIRGEVYDVAVDLRRGSRTFGKPVGVHLSARSKRMLFIPAGFAHGILALEAGTEILYKSTDFYSPEHERGILWSDPAIGIPWPKLDTPYLLSEKDRDYPLLKGAECF